MIEASNQDLAIFDVSGRHGQAGRRGADGAGGALSGANGRAGGDAGPAEPGQNAGSIRLELSTAQRAGHVRLAGNRMHADGVQESIETELPIGDSGFIRLLAQGGRGGRGGDGGRGGGGARGSDGSDATRYSSGGDGGPGGNGGRGGNATNGAPGGRGGEIIVVVSEEDTQLLMLIDHELAGGEGGDAGVNGRGGSGGRGGDGGDSYSWTTTESYTDSNGDHQTRTRYHRNPGGSDGPSGFSGRSGAAKVHRGATGAEGTFRIEVVTKQGTETYPSRYDLRLESFEHESLNRDGVYEPGETIRAFDMVVENTGGMPTPAHSEVHLTLQREGWVEPEEAHLVIPAAVGPGERVELAGQELRFRVGDFQPHRPGEALACVETVWQRARLPDVRREFTGFGARACAEQGEFLIRFPVQVSAIASLHALAPGEAARIRWSVANHSIRDLGARSESGRVIRLKLALTESELAGEHVKFFDDRGELAPIDAGFVREIDNLGAGATQQFEGTLTFTGDAPHYLSANLWLTLELGYLDDPASARPVQFGDFNTRVARRFQPDPDTDLLLVVNHRTRRDELEAWELLASRLGFELSVWDLTLERGLDLTRVVRGRTLLELFARKTLAVLDNPVETPLGEAQPHDFLDKAQALAAADSGLGVAVIGAGVDVEGLMLPTGEGRALVTGDEVRVDDFLERLEQMHEDDEPDPVPLDLDQVIEVGTRYRLFRKPKPSGLIRVAQRLQDELRDEYPERRFFVVYDYSPRVTARWLWMKRYTLGRLTVRRSLDAAAGMLVSTHVPDSDLHDPVYILGHENITTLLLTRGLDEKLGRLDHLLYPVEASSRPGRHYPAGRDEDPGTTRDELTGLAVDAILVDLEGELRAVLGNRHRAGLSRREMLRSCVGIRRLAQARFSGRYLAPDSREGAHLIRLAARLTFFSASQVRLWERVPPFSNLRRAPRLLGLAKRSLRQFLEQAFDHPDEATARKHHRYARKAVRRRVRELKRRYKEARKSMAIGDIDREEYARLLLGAPLEGKKVTTDAEGYVDDALRLLTRSRYDQIASTDANRADRRAALMAAADDQRGDLLLEESCEELLHRGPPEASG